MSLKRIGEDTSDDWIELCPVESSQYCNQASDSIKRRKWNGCASEGEPHTCEFAGPSSAAKVPRLSYQIVLDEESEQPTDEDEESVHSIQGKETDWAQDTSDTTTHSDWSGDVAVDVEYEVASLPEKENPLGDGSLSSDTDGIVCAAGMVVLCDDELSLLADTSGNSDSPQTIDPEVPRADYWTCVQCKNKNNNPLFRYCEKCYKVRKNFFPPRPHRKKRKRRASCSHKKESSVVKSLSTAPVDTLSDIHVDSGLGSSQGSSLVIDSKCETDSQEASIVSGSGDSDMCVTCMVNPKNGIFVHRKIGHICCCYKCALKVWTEAGRCPVCNCKVNTVLKAIVL